MGYIIWSIEFQVLTLKKVLTSKSLILQKRKKKERLPRVFGHDVLSFEMSLVMKLMLLLKYALYIYIYISFYDSSGHSVERGARARAAKPIGL